MRQGEMVFDVFIKFSLCRLLSTVDCFFRSEQPMNVSK